MEFSDLCDDVFYHIFKFLPTDDLYVMGWINERIRRLSENDRYWKGRIENDIRAGRLLPDRSKIMKILRRKSKEEEMEDDGERTVPIEEEEEEEGDGDILDAEEDSLLIQNNCRQVWEEGRRKLFKRKDFIDQSSYVGKRHSQIFFIIYLILPLYFLTNIFLLLISMIPLATFKIEHYVYFPISMSVLVTLAITTSVSAVFCHCFFLTLKFGTGLRLLKESSSTKQEMKYFQSILEQINENQRLDEENPKYNEDENQIDTIQIERRFDMETKFREKRSVVLKLTSIMSTFTWIYFSHFNIIVCLSCIGSISSILLGAILFYKIGLYAIIPAFFTVTLIMLCLLIVFIYTWIGDLTMATDFPTRITDFCVYCGWYACLCGSVSIILLQFILFALFFSETIFPHLRWMIVILFFPSYILFCIMCCACPFCHCLCCCTTPVAFLFESESFWGKVIQYGQICQCAFGDIICYFFCCFCVPVSIFIVSYSVIYITGASYLYFLVFLPLMAMDCLCMCLMCASPFCSHTVTISINKLQRTFPNYFDVFSDDFRC